MKAKLTIATAACAFAFLAACTSGKYKVEGTVNGADPESFITLERADANGGWLVLDSVKISDGKFSFSGEPTGAPEIFRLRMDGKYIYLPIDSTETVTVTADARNFASSFSLSGSDNARNMEAFEKKLIAFAPKADNPDSLNAFKRTVYTEFLKEAKGSVVSYYILTKTLGKTPLYDHADDYKYFAAVATSFKQFRPDDPRTALLEHVASEGLRRHNTAKGKQRVVEAEELKFIELSLPDEKGEIRRLSDLAGKGKTTVIVFADMTDEKTPALNLRLRDIAPGVNIYQVSFDADRFAWRDAAANLPWTTVWAGDVTNGSKTQQSYNVQQLPLFFIINSAGNLVDRASSFEELRSKI